MNNFQDKSALWSITPEEKAKHDNQFYMMKPIAGYLTGEQVKSFFLQSGLPQPVLGKIWQLSDLNADGKMDKQEFSIAMYLIKKALLGFEIPHTLPANFLTDVSGGSVFNPGIMSTGVMGAVYGGGIPPLQVNSYTSATLPYGATVIPTATVSGFSTLNKSTSSSSSGGGEWVITPGQRLRYKQMFNNHDAQHKGYLTGLEAKSLLSQSGLTHSILAQIWCLADIDTDGNLSPDEFCVAMYLIDQAKSGFAVPATLPIDLVPPSYRRVRRMSENVTLPLNNSMPGGNIGTAANQSKKADMFGDLGKIGGSMVATSPDTTSNANELEPAKIITFEDKRKENFDRGQAELEKRRAQLRDFQMQESEERLAAERAEQEKREKLRLEQELKKQQELERQFEKQRQIELEKEEQRRKVLEQKEAARRELERQRQLEWERQRRDQLLIDRNREESFVDALKQETSQLKLQYDSMSTKKQECLKKIDLTKTSITDMSSTIDSMKLLSLSKSTEIDVIASELEEIEMKLVAVQQESIRLMKQRNTPDHINDETWQALKRDREDCRSRSDELKKKLEIVESVCMKKEEKMKELQSQLDALNLTSSSNKKSDNRFKSAFHSEKFERGPSIFNNFEEQNKDETPPAAAAAAAVTTTTTATKTTTASKVSPANLWEDAFSTSALSSKSLFDDVVVSRGGVGNDTDTWSNAFDNSDTKHETSSSQWASFADTSQDANQSSTWTADFNSSFVPFTTAATAATNDQQQQQQQATTRKYKALYRFDARNPDELSLMEEDVVLVYPSDQVNAEPGWIIGRMNRKEGCFPEAYVTYVGEVINAPTITTTTTTTATTVVAAAAVATSTTSTTNTTVHQQQQQPSNTKVYEAFSDKSLFDDAFNSTFNSSSTIPSEKNSFLTSVSSSSSSLSSASTTLKQTVAVNKTSSVALISQRFEEQSAIKGTNSPVNKVLISNSPTSQTYRGSPTTSRTPLPGTSLTATTTNNTTQDPTSLTSSGIEPPLRVQAVYQWQAKKDNHLTFSKGDIITVLSQQDLWWFGEVAGKSGWFPKSYVKALGASETPFPINPPEVITESYETSNGVTLPKDPTTSLPLTPPSDLPERHKLGFVDVDVGGASGGASGAGAGGVGVGGNNMEEFIVVAMFTYASNEPGDLSFNQGDVFPAQKTDDDWWTGTINGVTGIFPATYVQEMETMNRKKPARPDKPPTNASKLSDNKKPEVASVIAAYPATGPEQLTLQPGQLIHVRKKSPSGWWEGELQAKGQKRKIGWFPANYVKLLGAGPSHTTSPADPVAMGSAGLRVNESSDTRDQGKNKVQQEQVVAMYNYQSQADDDLSFHEGNVINLIEKTNADWWKGELDGVVGIFPANYVALISNSKNNSLNRVSS